MYKNFDQNIIPPLDEKEKIDLELTKDKVNIRKKLKIQLVVEKHEKKWNKRIRNMGYRYL